MKRRVFGRALANWLVLLALQVLPVTAADPLSLWTRQSSGTTNDFYGVAYGGGAFAAVGIAGGLYSSPDGAGWTKQTSGTTNAFEAVTYGNGLFVAVGENGSVRTSPDGTTWTRRPSNFPSALHAVAYGNGLYVAVGFSGSILTSPDAITWTPTASSPTTSSLHAITWGNGLFVAAGSSGTILTSTDGSSWANRNSGTGSALHTITYGAGRFVMGGFLGTLLTSTDGLKWTPLNSGTTNSLRGAIYANSTFVVAGFRGTIISSANGTDWTAKSSGVTNALRGICFDSSAFLAAGHEGTIIESGTLSSEPAPVASFTASLTGGVPPLTVIFADNSTGTINNRSWDFGDGSTSNTVATSVTHAYTAAGSYTVSLTVNGPAGANTQSRPNCVVVTNPPALISVSPASLSFGMTAVGQVATLTLDVLNQGGENLSGTAVVSPPFSIVSGSPFNLTPGQKGIVSVAFNPTQAGDYNSSVTFSSNGGGRQIPVSGSAGIQPIAAFTGSPTSGVGPLAVTFTDNSTGTITSRTWDLVDGGTSSTVATTMTHTYATAGSYTVSLTVSGPAGTQTQTRNDYVTVTNPPPGLLSASPVDLNFGILTVGQNKTLTFDVVNQGGQTLTGTAAVSAPFSVSSGSPFSLAPGQKAVVSVTFNPTQAGDFTASVTFASDGGSIQAPISGSAAIAPAASFTGAPTMGASPLLVAFTDGSTGTITNRLWDFGDGTTDNTGAPSVTHNYSRAGTYSVRLTVTGPLGSNSLTRDGFITVTNLESVPLTIQFLANEVHLSWPSGTLQSAPEVTGPYTELASTSPYVVGASSRMQFFRVKVR